MTKRVVIVVICILLAVIIIGGPIYKRWIRDSEDEEDLEML